MLRQAAAEFVDTAATPTAAECVAEEDDDSGICSASNSKRYESDCGQFISHTRRHPGWKVLIRKRLHGEHIPDHRTARPPNCQTTRMTTDVGPTSNNFCISLITVGRRRSGQDMYN